jgi:hypothetical protein
MRYRSKYLDLFLAILAAILVLSACRHGHEVTYRVILPNGYVGWVRIDFGANVPLPTDSTDTVTFRVGDDGKVWTDAVMVITAPVTHYEFFYETPSGLSAVPEDFVDHRINAGGLTSRSDDPRGGGSWYFFVGPKTYREQHPVQDYVSHRLPLPTPGRMTD